MNPNDIPEVCECGHEVSDHRQAMINGTEDIEIEHYCMGDNCMCSIWRPKDDQFYVEREFDARAEKWERSRE